jgi:hypothetical protein
MALGCCPCKYLQQQASRKAATPVTRPGSQRQETGGGRRGGGGVCAHVRQASEHVPNNAEEHSQRHGTRCLPALEPGGQGHSTALQKDPVREPIHLHDTKRADDVGVPQGARQSCLVLQVLDRDLVEQCPHLNAIHVWGGQLAQSLQSPHTRTCIAPRRGQGEREEPITNTLFS